MNRNQKIAIGCGGAGCLGLIVVAIAVGLIFGFAGYFSSSSSNRNYNFNSNSNRTNRNSNSNANSISNANSASTSTSSLSSDDKHKLFQAAGMTKDSALITKVLKKIGYMDQSGTPTSDYEQFVKDHFSWALKNTQFVMSVNTEEKARAYVNEHMSD